MIDLSLGNKKIFPIVLLTVIITAIDFIVALAQTNSTQMSDLQKKEILWEAHNTYMAHHQGKIQEADQSGMLHQEYQQGNIQVFYPHYKNGEIDRLFTKPELKEFYFHRFNEKEFYNQKFDNDIGKGDYMPVIDMKPGGDIDHVRKITETPRFEPYFVPLAFNLFCQYIENWPNIDRKVLQEHFDRGELIHHKNNLETGYYDEVFNNKELRSYFTRIEQELKKPEQHRISPEKIEKPRPVFEEHIRGKFNGLYKVMASGEMAKIFNIFNMTSCIRLAPPPPMPDIDACVAVINKNYVHTRTYALDNSGTITGESRVYSDHLGRTIQTQVKSFSTNNILANQTLYDGFGHPAINTLSAPLYQTAFDFKDKFITDPDGNNYRLNDYDIFTSANPFPGSVDDPKSVGNTEKGTLGWYYSNNNTDEPYVAASAFPYARTEYFNDPKGIAKRTAAAGKNYKMGSGHEGRAFTMPAGNELQGVFGTYSEIVQLNSTNHMNPIHTSGDIRAIKSISIDAEGREVIVFTSSSGKSIANCFSGLSSSCPFQSVTQNIKFFGQQCIDIHLPAANKNSLKFNDIETFGLFSDYVSSMTINVKTGMVIQITDLNRQRVLKEGEDYNIKTDGTVIFLKDYAKGSGYFRIKYNFTKDILTKVMNEKQIEKFLGTDPDIYDLTMVYELDYSIWSLNFYDLAGRLRKEVSPAGIDCNNPGIYSMATTYDYNSLGRKIASQSPDQGLTEYVYDTEGKIRFLQNAEQRKNNKFSYLNYDKVARVTEIGEYRASNSSTDVFFQNDNHEPVLSAGVLSVLDITDKQDDLADANCNSQVFVTYDKVETTGEIPATYSYKGYYSQRNLMGRTAKTRNENMATWYSYDQFGRITFTLKEFLDADFVNLTNSADERIKAIDYTYNEVGNLKETILQKHVPDTDPNAEEKLTHHFTYNADNQLTKVEISGADQVKHTQASYQYYLHGPLKRKEIGDGLQGIDYTYTINGKLKSINHPSLDNNLDPGKDGVTGSAFGDVFGLAIDYHKDDYVRDGTGIQSSSDGGFFNGLIHNIRFKTLDDGINAAFNVNNTTLIASTEDQFMTTYDYDQLSRVTQSDFGVYNSTTARFTTNQDFSMNNVNYDDNGNLQSLKSNGYAAGGKIMDNLDYTYAPGTNKTSDITDRANNSYEIGFDSQNGTSFHYNDIGQLTQSVPEGITNITYDPFGKVRVMDFTNGNLATYNYNDYNQKHRVIFSTGGSIPEMYWYLTDVNNNIIAIYNREVNSSGVLQVKLMEHHIYGDKRLGIKDYPSQEINYEITDHLGNIRAVVSRNGGSLKINSWVDYYAFGGMMPGRNFNPNFYRFGYQGQEKAIGSEWIQFGLRMYNPWTGRWNSTDPYGQYHSPYLAMGNNPVSFVDPTGGFANYSEAKMHSVLTSMYYRIYKAQMEYYHEQLRIYLYQREQYYNWQDREMAEGVLARSRGTNTINPFNYDSQEEYSQARLGLSAQFSSYPEYYNYLDQELEMRNIKLVELENIYEWRRDLTPENHNDQHNPNSYRVTGYEVRYRSVKTGSISRNFTWDDQGGGNWDGVGSEYPLSSTIGNIAFVGSSLGQVAAQSTANDLRNAKYAIRGQNLTRQATQMTRVARGIGITGAVIGTTISGYKIFGTNDATTIDYFDFGVGATALGAALLSNPVGWGVGAAIGISATVYFTGRLAYDFYEEVNK